MKELSLHILDLAENSIRAKAKFIGITIIEDYEHDLLSIEIEDDGQGMDKEMLKIAHDPFTTTRETRNVGLGLSLVRASALNCDGNFILRSERNKGTKVIATFKYSHIDRVPIGNIEDTIVSLVNYCNEIDLSYTHIVNKEKYIFSSKQIKNILESVNIKSPEVLIWIRDHIKESIADLYSKNKNLSINPYKTVLFDKKMI